VDADLAEVIGAESEARIAAAEVLALPEDREFNRPDALAEGIEEEVDAGIAFEVPEEIVVGHPVQADTLVVPIEALEGMKPDRSEALAFRMKLVVEVLVRAAQVDTRYEARLGVEPGTVVVE